MRKLFNNSILMFIFGALIFGSIGVLATVAATSITYEPSWTKANGDPITNVDEALGELYNRATSSSAAADNLVLYWKGNTYDNITGGWGSTITTNTWAPSIDIAISRKAAVFNNDHIDLSTNSTFQYVVANTLNKIDCTEYNYVTVLYTLTSVYSSTFNIESTLDPAYYSSAPTRIFNMDFSANSSNMITYPISCSEPGYISFSTIRGNSSDPLTNLKVYGVYLSKSIDQ